MQVKYRKHKKNKTGPNGVSASTAALGVKAALEASPNGKLAPMSNGAHQHRKSPLALDAPNHHGSVTGLAAHQQHAQQHIQHQVQQQQQQQHPAQVPRIANGNILKTALTNPAEVLHLRRRLETTVTSSRDAVSTLPYESAMSAICTLIYCDDFEDIATLKVPYTF